MQDSKFLWHLEYPDTDEKGWHQVELHATDASHALAVDPDHWRTEKPEPAVEFLAPHDSETDQGDHE